MSCPPRLDARRRHVEVALKPALDGLYQSFDRTARVADPIDRVRPYALPADREIAGFVAAGLAFGRVASVIASIDRVLAVMGPSPSAFVRGFDHRRDAQRLAGCVHRWVRPHDLAALFVILRRMLEGSGSLEAFFLDGDDPRAPDVGPALERFSVRALQLGPAGTAAGDVDRPGVRAFFSRPSTGSACKRLNLFLRWMVRSDGIDLGVWRRVSPSRLVVPLDVHVVRVGQCLGLTRYRSAGWRMAAEITAALRGLDAADPIRYDFALCHIGMLGLCGFRTKVADSRCPMRGVCRPRARRRSSSPRPSAGR
ncbi:MAG: TIGR02757 family protein [Acidobacteriota bacterium]